MKILTVLLILIVAGAVVKSLFFSFRGQSPTDYTSSTPIISLKQHLSGPILSEGLIYAQTAR